MMNDNPNQYSNQPNSQPFSQPVILSAPGKPLSFWAALILFFMLALSFVLNLILFFALAGKIAGPSTQGVVENFVKGDYMSKNTIVLIDISGLIASGGSDGLFGDALDMVGEIESRLDLIEDNSSVRAVIFRVNSPGGTITASDQIANRISLFRKARPDVKIISLFETVAASGGYYVTAGSDHIVSNPTCITGSIGVIMSFYNMQDLFSKIGLKDVTIKSGAFKDIGSPYRPMTTEEHAMFQDMVDEMYIKFVDIVEKGRTKMTRERILELADGRVFTGDKALEYGFVDEVGYLDEAISAAKKLSGITDAAVIRFSKEPTFMDVLLGSARNSNISDPVVEIKKSLYSKSPALMYLWRPE